MKHDDHNWVLEQLKEAQQADHDSRERAREAHHFVDARDGQWEPEFYQQSKGKPRYQFDMVNPIIDQVSGDIEESDFTIQVTPNNGEASEDVAETFDGLIRNIERQSRARQVYDEASRDAATCGFSAVRVVQEYVDGDSFDQDLVIKKIPNALDRVWMGMHTEQDGSDAECAWVLTGLTPEVFKMKYPDRAESGVTQDRTQTAYWHRNDLVMVGEYLYLKDVEQELVLMSDGKVYKSDELEPVADELAMAGIVEEKRRKRTKKCVYSRLFDADGWITKPRKTVFEHWIPVIPLYGNFKYHEDKVLYWGLVEKLMDPQRVMNYSLSREIEEGALAPRAKYWMTPEQAAGHEETLASLNTNTDPVQFYNPDPESPGAPQQNGGAQVNPGLRTISESMRDLIGQTAGMFAANMGDNPNVQSGIAIEALQSRGERSNNKYLKSREITQGQVGRILVDAIPRVYEPKRQVRLLNPDGSFEMATIGQLVMDQQTGETVVLNDLSQGTYDVSCYSGPSFTSRQSETVKALTEIGQVDPSVIEVGGDILLNNITSPGMDDLAARKRQQLFNAGLIPQEQMTEQEIQITQQQQAQPPQEDPNMVLARAEHEKAMADHMEAQNKAQSIQQDFMLKQREQEIKLSELRLKEAELQIEAQKAGIEIKLKGAQAAKTIAEAESIEEELAMVRSRVSELAEALAGQMDQPAEQPTEQPAEEPAE